MKTLSFFLRKKGFQRKGFATVQQDKPDYPIPAMLNFHRSSAAFKSEGFVFDQRKTALQFWLRTKRSFVGHKIFDFAVPKLAMQVLRNLC